jgi:hypothetical protein
MREEIYQTWSYPEAESWIDHGNRFDPLVHTTTTTTHVHLVTNHHWFEQTQPFSHQQQQHDHQNNAVLHSFLFGSCQRCCITVGYQQPPGVFRRSSFQT